MKKQKLTPKNLLITILGFLWLFSYLVFSLVQLVIHTIHMEVLVRKAN